MDYSLQEEEDDYGEESDDRTTLNGGQEDNNVLDPSKGLLAKSPREMLLSKDNSFVIDSERKSSSDSQDQDQLTSNENCRRSLDNHASKPPKRGSSRAITRLDQIEKSKR